MQDRQTTPPLADRLYAATRGGYAASKNLGRNSHKKYSVGENSGYKLDPDGGIEVYVSATHPKGVPEQNWLPINWESIGMNGMFRIYAPELRK